MTNLSPKRFQGRFQSIKDHIGQLEKECQSLVQDFEKEKKLRERYETEVNGINKTKTKLDIKLKKDKEENVQFKEDLEKEREKRNKVEEELKKEKASKEKLLKEVEACKNKISGLENNLHELSETLKQLRTDLNSSQEDLDKERDFRRDVERERDEIVDWRLSTDKALEATKDELMRVKIICEELGQSTQEDSEAPEIPRDTQEAFKETVNTPTIPDYRELKELFLKAVAARDHTAIDELLSSGYNMDLPDELTGINTGLMLACKNGYRDVVHKLLYRGVRPNILVEGLSALHKAAECGHLDICKLLVLFQADVNIKNASFATPLHFAAMSGHVDICCLLLNSGASVHDMDMSGNTVLHYAVKSGKLPLVRLIVTNCLDIHQKNNSGQSPFDLACGIEGHKEVLGYFNYLMHGKSFDATEMS